MDIEKVDVAIIFDLYFNKMYDYQRLEAHFKGKYTYRQLKNLIRDKINKGMALKTKDLFKH